MFCTIATLGALFALTAGAEAAPVVPGCQQVSPHRVNHLLKVRRQITGHQQRFEHRPVCRRIEAMKHSVEHLRRECKRQVDYAVASVYTDYGKPIASTWGDGYLHKNTIGVANKTLPFGTEFYFHYGRRTVEAPVIDRGPYVAGRTWDLTGALQRALGFPMSVAKVGTTRRPCRGVF